MDALLTWLLTPLSGAAAHAVSPWVSWHARAMVLAWTILLPAGMLIARFMKVRAWRRGPAPLDDPAWWRAHLWLQSGGVAVMSAGLLLAWGHAGGDTRGAAVHRALGWTVVGIAVLQVLGGMLRGTKGGPTAPTLRGDHYDMTGRRLAFEWLHKHLGWLAVPPAIAATAIGLVLADAPRWMPVVIALWWAGFVIAFVALQRRGWCVDTYQAIWGADPAHPGNARRPVGLGVRRRG